MSRELIKRVLSSIILLPLVLYFIIEGSYYLIFFTIICFLVASYEWYKMVKKINYKLLGVIFLIFSFYSFYESTINYLWSFVFLVCISTDIWGYVFGVVEGIWSVFWRSCWRDADVILTYIWRCCRCHWGWTC